MRSRRGKGSIPPDSFAAVISDYIASDEFKGLRPGTRSNYLREYSVMQEPEVLGGYAAAEMKPAVVRQFLGGLGSPGKQSIAKSSLLSLQRWALGYDRLPHPITTGISILGNDGGHKPWEDWQVALAEAHASVPMSRLITLAVNTGQRGGDCCAMQWSHIEIHAGHVGIRVIQQKTGVELWVPFTPELAVATAQWDRGGDYLIPHRRGGGFTRPQISVRWKRERDGNPALAPLAGLKLHGLRSTAVVRLKRKGATVPDIEALVGMSNRMVSLYTRNSSQVANAIAAMARLTPTPGHAT
jgi:integrase